MMSLLAFVFTLTAVKLPRGYQCGGPSVQCEHQTFRHCRAMCGGAAHCDSYYFDNAFCEHSICWEIWVYFCDDGSWYYYECIGIGVCPI